MLSRRVGVALVAGVGIVIVALVVAGFALANRADEVASIDGHPVTRDELAFHVQRQESLDKVWRDKVLLILANEQGFGVPVDHEDFLTELAEENERRAKAVANGEVVYGLTEFSLDEYYAHRLAEIGTALKRRLGESGALRVTDAEVRRAFDANRDKWNAGATVYRYTKLVVRVPANEALDVQRRVAAASDLATAAARERDAELTTGTFDGAAAGVTTHGPDLLPVLEPLAAGELSVPVVGADELTYYRLDSKTVDADAAFAKYAQRIRQSLVDEKFDHLLRSRIATSDRQVDSEAIAAINAKDVQE